MPISEGFCRSLALSENMAGGHAVLCMFGSWMGSLRLLGMLFAPNAGFQMVLSGSRASSPGEMSLWEALRRLTCSRGALGVFMGPFGSALGEAELEDEPIRERGVHPEQQCLSHMGESHLTVAWPHNF